MNALQTVLVFSVAAVAGVGPFVAVHIGGKAFDGDEPQHDEPDDDTAYIPRVTDEADPYSY